MIPYWPGDEFETEKFVAQKDSLSMRFQGFAEPIHSRKGSEILLLTPYERINGLTTCEVPAAAAAFLRKQSRRVGTLLEFSNLKVRADLTLIADDVQISGNEHFKFTFTDHMGQKKGVHHFSGHIVRFGDNLQPVAMHGEDEAVVRLGGEEGKNLAGLLKSDFGRSGVFTVGLHKMREVKNLVFEQSAPKP